MPRAAKSWVQRGSASGKHNVELKTYGGYVHLEGPYRPTSQRCNGERAVACAGTAGMA